MSLKTETAKAKENKDNMKKVKAATDSTLVELGGEASTSLNDVPNKIRSLGTNLVNTSKEYTDSKVGDLNSLKTTAKDSIVNSINEIFDTRLSFKPELIEKTLVHTNWRDNMYDLDTEYPSTTCDIEIELSGNATAEHAKAWGKLIPVPDPTNKNNIKALGTIPSIDIPIRIRKENKGIISGGTPISWNDIIEKPNEFTPANHTHTANTITEDSDNKFVSDEQITSWDSKSNKSSNHKVTLLANGWTGSEAPFNYAINIPGMDNIKNWEVTNQTDPLMTDEQLTSFGEAKVIAGSQSTDTVNLIAYGTKPKINIPILIIVRGD